MASKPATKAKKSAAPATAAQNSSAPAAKQATPAAPQNKAETVSLKGVFEELAANHDLPKKQANLLLEGIIERLVAHLKKGVRIRMNGLGILEVKNRAARKGRNPATGAAIEIAASKKVAFRPAKELKDAV